MIRRVVRIETRTVGDYFGTAGVVRDSRTGRKLHETEPVPYGFDSAAIKRAEAWAAGRDYRLACLHRCDCREG